MRKMSAGQRVLMESGSEMVRKRSLLVLSLLHYSHPYTAATALYIPLVLVDAKMLEQHASY